MEAVGLVATVYGRMHSAYSRGSEAAFAAMEHVLGVVKLLNMSQANAGPARHSPPKKHA